MTAAHELFPWQEPEWDRRIAPALTSDRLGHALLLAGAPGIGKRHLAGVLARALLCRSPEEGGRPCGACRSCVQVEAGSHPDFASLLPEEPGKPIRIDPVREFVRTLYLTSQYGQGRVGLIDPADRLTTAAANSLLKALEEPPAGSRILLVSDRPRAVIATIRSRCQTFRLTCPDADAVTPWLAEAPEAVARAMPLARGAPLRAAALAESGGADDEDQWLDGLVRLASGKAEPVALAEAWSGTETSLLLDWLYLVASDLLKFTGGAGAENLALAQHAPALAGVAERLDTERLRRWIPGIARARRLADTPVDSRLTLEWLCIGLFECRRTTGAGSAPKEANA